MLGICTSKLSCLTDSKWFGEFGFNIALNRRKMFLGSGSINPHFEMDKFNNNTDYDMMYISYSEDGENDCLSVGFNCCDISVRLKIYESFLQHGLFPVYLLEIPEYKSYPEQLIKLFSGEDFNYFAAVNANIKNLPEEFISGIIYTDNFSPDVLLGPVSSNIDYVNTVMKNADIFLLKTPRYGGYNYVIFYSKAKKDISENLREIFKEEL